MGMRRAASRFVGLRRSIQTFPARGHCVQKAPKFPASTLANPRKSRARILSCRARRLSNAPYAVRQMSRNLGRVPLIVHNARDSWNAVLGELQVEVTRPSYETWLKDTVGLSRNGNELVVGVDNPFAVEMLEGQMHSTITRAAQRVVGSATEVRFTLGTNDPVAVAPSPAAASRNGATPPPSADVPTHAPKSSATGRSALNPKFTFSSFVVGDSNDLAHAAAFAVSENPGSSYNPLFLYSSVGLGKTHLLHAIGHAAIAMGLTTIYQTTEEFTNEYITAIREAQTDEFRTSYRSVDLLLLDDIQFIIGKEQTQEGFFHTFNSLHMSGRQIVITSDRPVPELTLLENRVRSRLEGGLVVDIQPPGLETRLAILRKKADAGGYFLPFEVLNELAERFDENVRELEGALNRVTAYAQLVGEAITLDLVKRAVADMPGCVREKRLSDGEILNAVSSHFSIDPDTLTGRQRDKMTARARHIAMYLLREEAKLSLGAIGTLLGGKGRSTVLHGYHRISSTLDGDAQLRQDITDIRNALRNNS